ncbi:hypothetical protein BCR35DRAFT_308060 [Leucosporidium creatinivorum]|uniref:Uncharacterized protein n=1 Tax=Leucosporidium creatinivorum TaxID=106004 RepID=A0A1Y2ECH0_9BASI|nr:hypothetical protein BCR35DRAFT_308060 [Leucosporidium creatinivorum]
MERPRSSLPLLPSYDGKTALDFSPTPRHLQGGDLQGCLLANALSQRGAASKCSSTLKRRREAR